jgi:hypothetical protein
MQTGNVAGGSRFFPLSAIFGCDIWGVFLEIFFFQPIANE